MRIQKQSRQRCLCLLALIFLSSLILSAEPRPRDIAAKYFARIENQRSKAGELDQILQDMSQELAPHGISGLRSVASFTRDPRLSGRQRCIACTALSVVGADFPEEVVQLLTQALPMEERVEDECVARGMLLLGPPAYPALLQCATRKALLPSHWCLIALIAQSQEIEGLQDVLGFVDENGEPVEPELHKRAVIRRTAKKWRAWWAANQDRVTWNPETKLLELK